jgi:hypothetical protein
VKRGVVGKVCGVGDSGVYVIIIHTNKNIRNMRPVGKVMHEEITHVHIDGREY